MHDSSLPNGQTRGVFRAEPRDGPVVACALLESATRTAQTSRDPGTVAAMGFEKEIRVVRFVGEGYEVLHRVLVDAPGPVRSIAVHGGWLFASTEFQTALPSTLRNDGNHFAREPVNFAFQNAARFAGEGTKAGMSETAILIGDDGRDAEVETPFLRARREDPSEKTKRLQDMVQPFLPAELRGSLPPAEVSEGSEGVKEAERRDPRATLQAFALENLQNAFEDEDDEEEEFVAARLSLPLAPTARRPEICALQSLHEGRDGRKSGYVVALTDVGASTGASVAVAELVRGSRRDFRLAARGTASIQTRSDAKTETKTKPRVEAFGRIARFSGAQKSAGAKAFGLDVALLTSETNDSETPNADAGFRIFGGGATKKKKPAPPASLATIRVSLDVTRRSRAVDDAPTARAPSEGVPTTPSSSRARRTNEGEALNPPEAPRVEPPELSDPRSRAMDFERVLAAIRALDGAVHDRFDRVEATLQIQERRLRRVEESLLKK